MKIYHLLKFHLFLFFFVDIINQIKEISLEVINSNISNNYVEFNKIKTGIRESLGKFLYTQTECKPMIITVINEI